MSIVKYEIMKVVAETKNFTLAAEKLSLTQSAVSRSIRNLEDELGSQLFIRKKSGVHLTRFGEHLLPQVEVILQANNYLIEQAEAYLGNLSGELIIGSFTSASSSVLPDLIAKFRKTYPDVQVEIKEGHYDEIKRWLQEGTVDFGFLIDEFIDIEEKIHLFTDEVKLLAPHDWIKTEKASLKVIERLPFIATEHYPNPYLEGIFKRHNIKPNVQYVVRTNQSVFAFIDRGLGIALIPESALPKYKHDFQILDLKETILRKIHLVTMDAYLTQPIVKAFWKMVQSEK